MLTYNPIGAKFKCESWSKREHHPLFLAAILRLRPVFIRASRVRPSTPPLFQRVDLHFFEGQFGGSSVSGIQRCPQTSHSATRIVFQAMPPLYIVFCPKDIIALTCGQEF